MSTARTRRLTGVLAVVLATGTGVATASGISSAHPRDRTLDVQLLSFNDFHGNLAAPLGLERAVVTDRVHRDRGPAEPRARFWRPPAPSTPVASSTSPPT